MAPSSPFELFDGLSVADFDEKLHAMLAGLGVDVEIREATDPRATLLGFLESGYQAGADALAWDRTELTSSWCPSPEQVTEFLAP